MFQAAENRYSNVKQWAASFIEEAADVHSRILKLREKLVHYKKSNGLFNDFLRGTVNSYILLLPLVEHEKLKFYFDRDINRMTKKLEKIRLVH